MIKWIVLFLLGISCLHCQTTDLIAEKSVTCSSDSMIVRFRFQKPFAGSIFTERGFSHEKCHWSGASNLEVNVQVPILNTTECGVAFNQETGEFAVKLIVSPVDGLIVDGFTAINVRCIYLTQDITLTLPANQDGKHALSISGSTIEGSVVTGTGGAPLLSMQILEGHGITGQPVARASVGQRITLDILLKDTSIYDFYVHSCFAHDGTSSPDASIQIIDTHGCGVRLSRAVDVPVLTSSAIDGAPKHVYLHMYGFQFTSSQFVHFECQVKPCVHSCKREQCETPTSSVPLIPARRRRDGWQENSVSSVTDEKGGEAMENLRLSTVLQIEPQRTKRDALVWSSENGLDGCPSIRIVPLLIAAAGLIIASVISTLAFLRLFSKSPFYSHSTKS